MRAQAVERIETAVDMIASILFATATGFVIVKLLRGVVDFPLPGVMGTVSALGSSLLCFFALRRVGDRSRGYRMAEFTVLPLEPIELDELVLTDLDRLRSPSSVADEPLVLDDVLAQMRPDSRVVRLFDPSAMPTPGQLKSRIDRHLVEANPVRPADASKALFEALAELRRSLA
jgi:hypothetical protein